MIESRLTKDFCRFGIDFASDVVKADGNVRNLAWRICNAKQVLVSFRTASPLPFSFHVSPICPSFSFPMVRSGWNMRMASCHRSRPLYNLD